MAQAQCNTYIEELRTDYPELKAADLCPLCNAPVGFHSRKPADQENTPPAASTTESSVAEAVPQKQPEPHPAHKGTLSLVVESCCPPCPRCHTAMPHGPHAQNPKSPLRWTCCNQPDYTPCTGEHTGVLEKRTSCCPFGNDPHGPCVIRCAACGSDDACPPKRWSCCNAPAFPLGCYAELQQQQEKHGVKLQKELLKQQLKALQEQQELKELEKEAQKEIQEQQKTEATAKEKEATVGKEGNQKQKEQME